MGKKTILYIALLLLVPGILNSQEVVTGLQVNIKVKNASGQLSKGLAADTLSLPFFDDFSGDRTLPDPTRWSDDFAFINNTYSNDQITTGIATLDALSNTGGLYEAASNIVFEADHLTSQPIYLNLPPSDSIRLSFHFQPGGLGDMPEVNDTLVLQLYAPAEDKWYHAWTAEGGTMRDFKAVVIRIDNPRFLKKGFRFRFINHASLSTNLAEPSMAGNCDHWNIDYILLDRYRSDNDTLYQDVAFRSGHRSLLKSHESMPAKHFRKIILEEMGLTIPIHFRNNDVIVRNVTRNFEIRDIYKNSIVKTLTAGTVNIDPQTDADDAADLIYSFNTGTEDSALFRITSWLITDNFDPKANDTVKYYQRFSNYFAFDDGSSEGGYGINGLGSRNAMVAYRFKAFVEDTLRAIRICFNDSYLNANQRVFDLMVWTDNEGSPGDLIYTQEKAMVNQGEELNGFYTYRLKDPVMVDGIFYVGWKQRSETFLNAGLDINTLHGGKQFYWINGNWMQSSVTGSLMIRPVTGDPLATGVNDILYNENHDLVFWPNPVRDHITIGNDDLLTRGDISIIIIDLQGRKIVETPITRHIDLTELKPGMYIIAAVRKGAPLGHNRLIKID